MFRFFEIVNQEDEELEESPVREDQLVWDIMTYWEFTKEKYREIDLTPPSFFLMLKAIYTFEIQINDTESI